MKKMSKMDISEILPEDYLKWDKEKFIEEKISANRTNNWYKQRYRRNINMALTLSVLSFLLILSSVSILKIKSGKVETYLTMTNGTVIKHEPSNEELDSLNRAINVIQNRKG